MVNVAFGLFLLVMGLIFLIFNKAVTKWHIMFQTVFFGYDFDDRDRVIIRIFFIIGGIIFSAVGALILLRALSLI